MGSKSPVNSYYNLATFIDRNHMNDIVMVMENEMIYNTFDATALQLDPAACRRQYAKCKGFLIFGCLSFSYKCV